MAGTDVFTADFRAAPWRWDDCRTAEEPRADLPRAVDVLVLDAERLGWGANSRNVNEFDTGTMPTHPLFHGKPWFLPVVGTCYQARDWLDRRRDA